MRNWKESRSGAHIQSRKKTQSVRMGRGLHLIVVATLALTAHMFTQTNARSITHPLAMDNVGIMHPRQSAFFGMSPTYRSAPPLARRGHFPPKLRYSDEEPRRDEKRSKEIYDDFDEDEMIDDEGNYDYEPRVGAVRRRSEMKREEQLKQLYDEINRKFPFLAKQGLKGTGKTPSLDDLFALTLFGQPRASRRG